MRPFLFSFPKRVTDQENPSRAKIDHDGCADGLKKMTHTDKQLSEQGRTKAEMEHWDTVMSEQLGEDASYNQPLRLRVNVHTGRWTKIKQADGQALPVKQHPESYLAVKMVTEREQQMAAEGNLWQEESKANPSSSSSSQCDGWWTSSWRDMSWQWTERQFTTVLANLGAVSGESPKVATRDGWNAIGS